MKCSFNNNCRNGISGFNWCVSGHPKSLNIVKSKKESNVFGRIGWNYMNYFRFSTTQPRSLGLVEPKLLQEVKKKKNGKLTQIHPEDINTTEYEKNRKDFIDYRIALRNKRRVFVSRFYKLKIYSHQF
jgi:hypothetical protein